MSQVHTYLEFLSALDDQPLRLKEGETLFAAGDSSDGRMFIVRTGSVDLRSGRKLLERVAPGGILGEMALIDPAPRSATAIGGPDCSVSPVTELMFHKLVTHVPGFALEMMRILVRRFRQATGRVTATRQSAKRRRPTGKVRVKAKGRVRASRRKR